MSGLASLPNTPNKKMSGGEGQRKEIDLVQAHRVKRQSKHFSPSSMYRHEP
jgi:hypothetical protein